MPKVSYSPWLRFFTPTESFIRETSQAALGLEKSLLFIGHVHRTIDSQNNLSYRKKDSSISRTLRKRLHVADIRTAMGNFF